MRTIERWFIQIGDELAEEYRRNQASSPGTGYLFIGACGLYCVGSQLWLVVGLYDVATGDLDGAAEAAWMVAELAGVMGGMMWAGRAVNRWRDRAIARLMAAQERGEDRP